MATPTCHTLARAEVALNSVCPNKNNNIIIIIIIKIVLEITLWTAHNTANTKEYFFV